MEFNEANVYSAVNAEKLEEGDVVIVNDTLKGLRYHVDIGQDVEVIKEIKGEECQYRFDVSYEVFAMAYLIAKHDDPYKAFKRAQAEGKEVWFRDNDDKWHSSANCNFDYPVDHYSLTKPVTEQCKVFLHDGRFVFTEAEVPDGVHVYYTTVNRADASIWCIGHNKFADVATAWEEGQQIQYLDDVGGWSDCNPCWNPDTEYRVKPASLKWTDLKCGDVISDGDNSAMVTCIDSKTAGDLHIHAGYAWITDEDLETKWEKV